MNNQTSDTGNAATTGVLERIAQGILVAHAWVTGPAMTEQQRMRRELAEARNRELSDSGISG